MRSGVLSGGHVQAIVANLTDRSAGLFSHHETELVPELAQLSVSETAVAMQDWAQRADAMLRRSGSGERPASDTLVSIETPT